MVLRRRTRQSGPLGELFDHSKFKLQSRVCFPWGKVSADQVVRRRCLQHRVGCLDLLSCDELWSVMVYCAGDVWLYVQCPFGQLMH